MYTYSFCIPTFSMRGTRSRLRALVGRQNPESEDTDVEWRTVTTNWNLQASFHTSITIPDHAKPFGE